MQNRVALVLRHSFYCLLAVSILVLPLSPVAAFNVEHSIPVSLGDAKTGSHPGGNADPQATPAGPAPFMAPDEPVYLVNGYQIGRTLNFKSPYPNWQNITPTDSNFTSTRITDFVLDPFDPYNRALVTTNGALSPSQAGGVWVSNNLSATSPTWTQTLTFSQIATDYTNTGAQQGQCSVIAISRLVANPGRSGSYFLTVGSNTGGNIFSPCPEIGYSSSNGGRNWQAVLIHARSAYCNPYGCGGFGGQGGLAFGAGDQISAFEAIENYPTLDVSNDGGQSWQTFISPTLNGNNPLWDQNSKGMYASQVASGVALLLTHDFSGQCNCHALLRTSDAWSTVQVVSLTDNGTYYYPVDNIHSLTGFIGQDGKEHTYELGQTNVDYQSTPYLFVSLDMGSTWTIQGALPGVAWTGYAVNPLDDQYRLAATTGGASRSSCYLASPTPPPSATPTVSITGTPSQTPLAPSATPSLTPTPSPLVCPSIAQATMDGGQTWIDRTGDWLTSAQFGQGWDGGNLVVVTAPSFVQIRPPISPDQTAGFGSGIPAPDNWYLMPQADPTGSIQPVVSGVNPFTKNYAYSVTDLTINSHNGPLGFRRIYSVRHLSWKDNGLLGPGWTNNFQVRLIFPPTDSGPDPSDPYGEGVKGKVIFQDANGNRQEFDVQSDPTNSTRPIYTSARGYLGRLTQSSSTPYTYTLILNNQTRYIFDSFGRITQADRVLRDNTPTYIDWHPINFVYDTQNTFHLRCVVDGTPSGANVGQHYIALNYNSSGQIAEVSDNQRDNWNYCTNNGAYNPTGSPAMTFNYVKGYLDSVLDLTQGKWHYTYSQPVVTPVGAFNLLNSFTDPLAAVVESIWYDAQGRVVQKRDAQGRTLTSFNYGEAVSGQWDVKITDGLHSTTPTTYHYSLLDNLNVGMDFFIPDPASGQPVAVKTKLQTNNFRPFVQTDPYGRQMTTQFTNDEYWPQIISDNKSTWQFTVDDVTNMRLNVANAPIPNGQSSSPEIDYFYKDPNYSTLPTAVTLPFGLVFNGTAPNPSSQFSYYDPSQPTLKGNLKDTTDPTGMVTHYDYDNLGQISQITVNQGTTTPNNNLVTQFRYDSVGRQIASLDPLQRCNVIQYDNAGRVTKTIQNYDVADSQGTTKTDCLTSTLNDAVAFDPAFPDRNVIAQTHYDLAGKVDYTLDTLGNRTTYTYDSQRRVHVVTKDTIMVRQAKTTTYDYDLLGNLTQITDANNEVTRLCYDILNRQVRTIQNYTATATDPCLLDNGVPLGTKPDENVITSQVYDANGNISDTYNPLGQDTHVEYDRTRNLQSKVIKGYDPNAAADSQHNITTAFAYDVARNLQSTVDPNGQTTTFCYNIAGQSVRRVVNATSLSTPDATCAPSYFGNVAKSDQDLITNMVYNNAGQRTDTFNLMDVQVDAQNTVQSVLWDHQHTEYQLTGDPSSTTDEDYQSAGDYQGGGLPLNTAVYHGGQVMSTNAKTSFTYDNGGRTEQTADINGRNTHVYHDDVNRITKVIQNYQLNPPQNQNDVNVTTAVTYDGLGRPLTQIDANGRITTHRYDDTLGEVTLLDPLQHPSSLLYDVMGNVSQMTDANGNTTQFGYDGLYRQNRVTTAQKLLTQTRYDSLGNLTDEIDANQIDKHFTYDVQNRLTQVDENCNFNGSQCNVTGNDNAHTSYVYDQRGLLQSMTPSGSGQITYKYDNAGRRTTVNGALPNTIWSTTYDKAGRVRTQSAPNGATTTTTYQWTADHLHQTQISDFQIPLTGLTTTLNYDALGRVSTMTDSLGQTTYNYDGVDRLLNVQDPNQQTVAYTYYPDGNLQSLTMPGSKTLSYLYDGDGRLKTVTDWVSNSETYGYDPAGRLTDTSLPTNTTPSQVLNTHYSYDQDNQLRSIRNQTNSTLLSEFDYTQLDNVGNRKQVTELIAPTGISSATSTPVAGQPDQVTFASPRSGKWQLYTQSGSADPQPLPPQPEGAMSPSWSPDGTKLAFAGLQGGQWDIFTMDANGWNVTDVTPHNNKADDTSPAWSPDGKKIAFTSRVGGTADIYTVNPDGSAISRLTAQNGDNTSPSWSPDSNKIAFTSNRTGQWNIWTMAADGSNAAQLTTDATAPNTSPAWSPDNTKIAYSGVQNNNADLYTIAPAGGQPTLITNAASAPLDLQPAWSPDSSRLLFRSNRKTGPATDANYDLWAVNVNSTPNLQQITTGGFDNDQPTWTAAPSTPAGMTNRSIAYQYDGLNRLTNADYKDNGVQTRGYVYQYDYASNRTVAGLTTYGTAASSTSTDYYYNAANELTCSAPGSGHTASGCASITDPSKHSFSYDLAGNLQSETVSGTPLNTYFYNAAQQLISADNVSYTYNGLGDRYSKTIGGATTNYVFDLNRSLPQVLTQTTNGATTTYRGSAGEQKPDGSWSYYSKDGLGSVRQLSNATGQVTYAADYDPYGVPLTTLDTTKTTAGFTGQQTDENGLIDLRARDYNPITGTFLTRDPFGGSMSASASMNGYGYVEGNPANSIDPSGMCPQDQDFISCTLTDAWTSVSDIAQLSLIAISQQDKIQSYANAHPISRGQILQGARDFCSAECVNFLPPVAIAKTVGGIASSLSHGDTTTAGRMAILLGAGELLNGGLSDNGNLNDNANPRYPLLSDEEFNAQLKAARGDYIDAEFVDSSGSIGTRGSIQSNSSGAGITGQLGSNPSEFSLSDAVFEKSITTSNNAANSNDWMTELNPHSDENRPWCGQCAIAGDQYLAGNPPSESLPARYITENLGLPKYQSPEDLTSALGKGLGDIQRKIGLAEIEEQLLAKGNGARGIVGLGRIKPLSGHWFNAVNENGSVVFYDIQIREQMNLLQALRHYFPDNTIKETMFLLTNP